MLHTDAFIVAIASFRLLRFIDHLFALVCRSHREASVEQHLR